MRDAQERLDTELSLLQAMYPDNIMWDASSRELKYTSLGNSFQVRLPDSYPNDGLPQVLSATVGKSDVGEQVKKVVSQCTYGEEILDSIVLAFNDLSASSQTNGKDANAPNTAETGAHDTGSKLTVIIWLHHLLNTNKRKQALSPGSASVSGLTKPGYPGVLLYSGPSEAVREHVNELRGLNWQAFQVRLESEDEWTFLHGAGVREVKAMKDVVAGLESDRRGIFLEAMRMK